MTAKLTGGLVNYYLVPVRHPQRKEQIPYVAECEDIAEALQLTPNEFCEFKAIWRTAAARQGNGKPDHKTLYDAEKRLHYAGRDLAKYKRELEMVEPVWADHTTGAMPAELDPNDLVTVILQGGSKPEARPAFEWNWRTTGKASDIYLYRKV